MSFTFTRNRLRGIGFSTTNEIKSDLKAEGKDATSRLIRSVRFEEIAQPSLLSLVFKAESYYKFVDKGRRKGKMPPKAPILRWLRARGLDTKLEFVIRRKIARDGIPATNIFTNATDKLTKDFFRLTNEALEQDIINQTRESLTIK